MALHMCPVQNKFYIRELTLNIYSLTWTDSHVATHTKNHRDLCFFTRIFRNSLVHVQ